MPRARGPHSFPPEARVRRRMDYEEGFRAGRRVEARLFILVIRRREEGESRIGIVAGRKVGNAVTRNRIKRLIREVFRKERPVLPRGLDFILVARSRMAEAVYGEVEREFRAVVRRALSGSASDGSPTTRGAPAAEL